MDKDQAYLDDVFEYHAPDAPQIEAYRQIRAAAKALGLVLLTCCPASADRSAALRKLREAVMTANASIALNGRA